MPLGPPNLAPVVGGIFSFPVTWIEIAIPDPPVNADGIPIDGDVTATAGTAHIHPEQGAAIALSPEGQEVADTVRGYTVDTIQAGSESTGQRPTRVVYQGAQYEVTTIRPWASGPSGTITWREFVAVLVPSVEVEP